MRRLWPVAVLASLSCGCASAPDAPRPVERRAGRSGLINPLLDSEPGEDYKELRPFRDELERLIGRERGAGKAETVAVYFRDLNNGPVFGIDDSRKYTPASLMKVPLMFVVLKQAQADPSLLQRTVVYPDAPEAPKHPQATSLLPGRAYSVDDLVRVMIVKSDNGAAYVLSRLVDPKGFAEVYADLGLPAPDVHDTGDTVRIRELAAFFRILYNASYLDRRMSEKALEYLAAADFKEGLVAGARPGLVIAHKFGERYLENGVSQLSDCGIVYAPETAYILCVMTRGRKLDDLARVIQDVTHLIDSEIDKQLPDRRRR